MRHLPPSTRAIRRFPLIGGLVVVALAATALPAAAVSPYTRILVGSSCVEGHAYVGGGEIEVVQKRGGTTIATGTVPSATSDWNACIKPIKVGDTIRITQTVSSSVVDDRTLTVPALTVTLDAATDIQSGHVPDPGTLVNYGITPTVAGLDTYAIARGANADGSGNFSDDWTGVVDVRAGDIAKLGWYPASGDGFITTVATPSVGVRVGSAIIKGTGPNGPVTTTIKTASGTLRGTAKSAVKGYGSTFQGTFRSAGKAVIVKVGDRVRSTGIPGSYTVRASDLKIKKVGTGGNGSLTATCATGSDYAIFVNGVWTVSGMSGAKGAISNTNVTRGSGPVFAGSEVKLACRLPSGFGQVFVVTVK